MTFVLSLVLQAEAGVAKAEIAATAAEAKKLGAATQETGVKARTAGTGINALATAADKAEADLRGMAAAEALVSEMVSLLRSFRTPATVNLAVVLADTPDLIEAEYLDLQLLSADITDAEILLSISRDEIELEPFPSGRMTRDRFPGLHL